MIVDQWQMPTPIATRSKYSSMFAVKILSKAQFAIPISLSCQMPISGKNITASIADRRRAKFGKPFATFSAAQYIA